MRPAFSTGLILMRNVDANAFEILHKSLTACGQVVAQGSVEVEQDGFKFS